VKTRFVVACSLALAMTARASAADGAPEAATLSEAITGGKLLLNLRPRYEYVDLETRPDRAKALTLRTLLGWETKAFHGFSLTAQAIDVSQLTDDFNDDPAKASTFPLVADPDNTDINQIFLDYTGLTRTRVRLGKQSIKLDNVRFIGNVEFRQVMQVFNGIAVESKVLPNTEFYLAHLERVKNIFALTSGRQAMR
jgi:Alginate export